MQRTALAGLLRALISVRYRTVWADALKDTDAVIIGGGQLLSDVGLNFSLKIHHCLAEAKDVGSRAAIFAVGVSHPWSPTGKRQFLSAFQSIDLDYVAVRDQRSQARWADHIQGTKLPTAGLCRDPGLLAADTYAHVLRDAAEACQRPADGQPLVGVGVIHPNTLSHHGTHHVTGADAIHFWHMLGRHLQTAGYRIQFFTNGAADDEAFLIRLLQAAPTDLAASAERLPRPLTPDGLIANIQPMQAVIAHRLHATIVAYALKIPPVGLGWDAKVPAFFESIGRGAFAVDGAPPDPAQVATTVAKALATPIDPSRHATVIDETRVAIAECATAIDRALTLEVQDTGRR